MAVILIPGRPGGSTEKTVSLGNRSLCDHLARCSVSKDEHIRHSVHTFDRDGSLVPGPDRFAVALPMELQADDLARRNIYDGDLLDLLRSSLGMHGSGIVAQQADALENAVLHLPLEETRLCISSHLEWNAHLGAPLEISGIAAVLLNDVPSLHCSAWNILLKIGRNPHLLQGQAGIGV